MPNFITGSSTVAWPLSASVPFAGDFVTDASVYNAHQTLMNRTQILSASFTNLSSSVNQVVGFMVVSNSLSSSAANQVIASIVAPDAEIPNNIFGYGKWTSFTGLNSSGNLNSGSITITKGGYYSCEFQWDGFIGSNLDISTITSMFRVNGVNNSSAYTRTTFSSGTLEGSTPYNAKDHVTLSTVISMSDNSILQVFVKPNSWTNANTTYYIHAAQLKLFRIA